MISVAKGFPKQELIQIIELIDDLSRCASQDAAQELLTRTRNLLTAEFAVCGNGRIDEDGRLSINTIIDSGYPDEWLNLYFEEGLYRFDPVMRHHMHFSEPELWTKIREDLADDERARAVTEWAAAYGLKFGLSSSVHIPGTGMFSLFCFASSKDVFSERHKDLLKALTLHLNMAITEKAWSGPPAGGGAESNGPSVQ